jgi:hypothetical protein
MCGSAGKNLPIEVFHTQTVERFDAGGKFEDFPLKSCKILPQHAFECVSLVHYLDYLQSSPFDEGKSLCQRQVLFERKRFTEENLRLFLKL